MANQTVYPYGTGGELPSSIGIINDLTTGGVNKALSAEMGKTLNGNLTQLGRKVGAIVSVTEDGWFLTDEQLNAVLKYDADGLDAARVSEHFKSLFGGFIQVIESGIYFVDEQMNIGAKLTTDGFFAKNLMLYEII